MENLETQFKEWFDGLGLQHFKAREFINYSKRRRNGVENSLPPKKLWLRLVPTLRVLDELRSHFGRPCLILSAYRSPRYNRAVGGAGRSQHLQHRAIDFRIKGVHPKSIYKVLRQWRREGRFAGGLGLYTRSGFVHLDTRGTNATWGK